MTRLPEREMCRIREHARTAYPRECCGALLGRTLSTASGHTAAREVVRIAPLANHHSDESERRYVIPGGAVRMVERDAARARLEVVGFYHSHPDHTAEPSAYDLEHAWPWYTYLIVPVRVDGIGAPRGWRLTGDRSGFLEDAVIVVEEER